MAYYMLPASLESVGYYCYGLQRMNFRESERKRRIRFAFFRKKNSAEAPIWKRGENEERKDQFSGEE